MKGVILGAGFTGLAAAIKTGAPIYEASEHAGGICRSYNKGGFEFATGGGHWVFGKNKGYDYIKSLVPLNEYERKASVYFNHSFPYPFQTAARNMISPVEGTLRGWLCKNFSLAEMNMFFDPFNAKYTAGLYDEVIQDDEYKTPPAGGVGFVSTFSDPVGGLGTVVDKMAEKCNIYYKKKAIQIRPDQHVLVFEDGSVTTYDKLISTIPLNQMLAMCGSPIAKELIYSSVLVINIGAYPDVNLPKDHWIYVPFCKTNFYRIGFYSNVDKSKAPDGMVSLSVEMAFSPEFDYEDLDVDFIIQEVVKELQAWRFIGEVVVTDPTWVKYAYTWLKDRQDREDGLNWLKERDISSIGRYGAWKFCGFTQSIEMGLNVEV